MAINWDQSFETIDSLIVSGKIKEAQRKLSNIKKNHKLPRNRALNFSSLCNRVGKYKEAHLCLYPYIHPEDGKIIKPTGSELLEFSTALIFLGGVSEALFLLNILAEENDKYEGNYDKSKFHLISGFGHLGNWDFKKAKISFQNFLQQQNLGPYKEVIGRINLANCLLFNDEYMDAYNLLGEAANIARENDYTLLLSNIYEISMQACIDLEMWDESLKFAQLGKNIFGKNISPFIEKNINRWENITHYYKSGEKKYIARLKKDMAWFKEQDHPNIVRSLNYYIGLFTKNEKTLKYIYFGSPYEQFKKKIIQNFPNFDTTQDNFFTPDNLKTTKNTPLVKLQELEMPPLLQRFFALLCSDFFESFSLFKIQQNIFPDEFYNPLTTPKKIYALKGRLNQLFLEQELPLEVIVKRGNFKLHFAGPLRILVPSELNSVYKPKSEIDQAKEKLPEQFKTGQLIEVLGLSKRACLYLIKDWLEDGLLIKEGSGRSVLYRWS